MTRCAPHQAPGLPLPTSGNVLGFDFGEKRIGVATGNTTLRIAHPLLTLNVSSNAERINAVAALVAEWQPVTLIVGEPHHADGRPEAHPLAHLAHKFGNRLKERFRLPVVYVDETLSSFEASENMSANHRRGRAQKPQMDAAAAQVILQSWFDQQHAPAAPATLRAEVADAA